MLTGTKDHNQAKWSEITSHRPLLMAAGYTTSGRDRMPNLSAPAAEVRCSARLGQFIIQELQELLRTPIGQPPQNERDGADGEDERVQSPFAEQT